MTGTATTFAQSFFHGTKADLKNGELIAPGYRSNYGKGSVARHVYLTGTLDAAIWGAELAKGEGEGRIYVVEPTGALEDDPDLTNKKYPGNPTKSYRTGAALRVIGEVIGWSGHPPAQIKTMKEHVARVEDDGGNSSED